MVVLISVAVPLSTVLFPLDVAVSAPPSEIVESVFVVFNTTVLPEISIAGTGAKVIVVLTLDSPAASD